MKVLHITFFLLVKTHNSVYNNYSFEVWKLLHAFMLKVTLKVRNLGKRVWYWKTSQICSKTIENLSLLKNVFGKRKESSKDKWVTVKVMSGGDKKLYFWDAYFHTVLASFALFVIYNSIYEKLELQV